MRRNRKQFKRGAPHREKKPVVLIVCEGEKTEPNYFKQAIKKYNLSSFKINVKKSHGTDPKSIIKYAQTMKSKYENEDKEIDEYGAYLTETNTTDLIKRYNSQKKAVSKSRYPIHVLNFGISSITKIRSLKLRTEQ